MSYTEMRLVPTYLQTDESYDPCCVLNREGMTMTHKFATACFVIGSVLVPVVACAADADMDRGHPAAFVKDSVITTKIKAKLAGENLASLRHVRVDADTNGVVWLSGTVDSREDADKAVTIARNTEGVKSVSSDLKVQQDR